ncbi:MAG: transcription termination/antitermination protein NusG [Nannocystaceae bacterium]|nr:transcription termination/antitermination factor NusG [Myxococcales bacterium]
MDWYAVQTFSGFENSVKRSLEERIKKDKLEELFEEILVPSEEVTERRGKTVKQRKSRLVPGYVFIRMEMTDQARSMVQNTPKVAGFLGGKNPRPVREAEMNRMMGNTQPRADEVPEQPTPVYNYKVGQQVRVKSGPFANFTGEVEEVNADKQKIWLSVLLFGRPTRVEVDFAEVETVA